MIAATIVAKGSRQASVKHTESTDSISVEAAKTSYSDVCDTITSDSDACYTNTSDSDACYANTSDSDACYGGIPVM